MQFLRAEIGGKLEELVLQSGLSVLNHAHSVSFVSRVSQIPFCLCRIGHDRSQAIFAKRVRAQPVVLGLRFHNMRYDAIESTLLLAADVHFIMGNNMQPYCLLQKCSLRKWKNRLVSTYQYQHQTCTSFLSPHNVLDNDCFLAGFRIQLVQPLSLRLGEATR